MPFNTNDIEWNKVDPKPAQTHLDTGWSAEEKPPASIFNWFFNRCAAAIKDLLANAIHKDQKGVANGVASLGADGKVPSAQLSISAPADASTSVKGIVKLNSATDSVDETTAATPKAVKAAMDQATAAFTSADNGKALTGPVATAIVGKGGTVADSDADGIATFQELANGVNSIKRGQGNAVEAQVLSGSTFSNSDGVLRTGTMPNKSGSATVITPGTTDQVIPQGYFGGVLADGKVKGDPDLIAPNIARGKNIFEIVGTAKVPLSGNFSATGPQGTTVNLGFQPSVVIWTAYIDWYSYGTIPPDLAVESYYGIMTNPGGSLKRKDTTTGNIIDVGNIYDLIYPNNPAQPTTMLSNTITSTGFTLPKLHDNTYGYHYMWEAY